MTFSDGVKVEPSTEESDGDLFVSVRAKKRKKKSEKAVIKKEPVEAKVKTPVKMKEGDCIDLTTNTDEEREMQTGPAVKKAKKVLAWQVSLL